MKAFILAAGRGSRLAPLTDALPKILAPVLDVPMLDRIRVYLAAHGVTALALNTHHLAESVEGHLAQGGTSLPILRRFHEPELLGTGGALVNAAAFWGDDPLLVWNGDILCGLDPRILARAHQAHGAAATLVVQAREGDSHLLVDEAGLVCGLDSPRRGVTRMAASPAGALASLAFNGISILSPEIRTCFPSGGAFDLIDALLECIQAGKKVRADDAGDAFYGTTGSRKKLRKLEAELIKQPGLLAAWTP